MDQNQTDIIKYINNLPVNVQDVIYDSEWEQRITEITKKYSLNQEQTENLINLVLLVLVGIEKPETLMEKIILDLSISKLLAEQIINDLEKRVFDYALNMVENKTSKPSTTKPTTSTVPEIRPENLPMVEDENTVSIPKYFSRVAPAPTPSPVQTPTKSIQKEVESEVEAFFGKPNQLTQKPKEESSTPSRIVFGKTDNTTTSSPAPISSPTTSNNQEEFVQKPGFIPKFGNTSFNDPLAPVPTPQTSQSIIDNKLSGTTSSQIEKPPQTPPVHEYVVDPYREPLE